MESSINSRQKSKRPQLACSTCRARKVKCDRLQPCTACSLNTNAHNCHYDLTHAERQPILQAEALRERGKQLKEKDKVIAQLQNEKRNLEELLKRASPTSDLALPSAWTNSRFDALHAKQTKAQRTVTFGFTHEEDSMNGSMEQGDRLMACRQDANFPIEAPGQSGRYRILASQNQTVPHQNHFETPVRSCTASGVLHQTQRDSRDTVEDYSSVHQYPTYETPQMEALSIDQLADLRTNLASRSAMSEPCSPPKKAHRKASTSSDSKSRAAVMKRSWKPPTPPSSQNSEEAWQITTIQLPSHDQKTGNGKKSRSGSNVARIDTTQQEPRRVESPLPSVNQAHPKRFFKTLEKYQLSPQTQQAQQSHSWYNAFPVPQADTPMPTLVGGVTLPLRRNPSSSFPMNLPGPFDFLGRGMESAPQCQGQAVGPSNIPMQHAAPFPGNRDIQMQDPECFTPWMESHQWPTWQEAPATYQ